MTYTPTGNYYADKKYWGETSFFGGIPPLSEGVGFAIVLGFGVFFSAFASVIHYLDVKYNGTSSTSEHFNTAGRNIGTGLTACVIVSSWTWAATLLQSSNVAYNYGVSGPFWYAAGASIQILLFGVLAIEIKRKAPKAHTIGEIIRARWGDTTHKCFLYFLFLTNIIVISMLILGGAAVVNALTGMELNLASFLIPFGIIVYTGVGGLKATFVSAYIHTAFIYVILCIFCFEVYQNSKELGSADEMWTRLTAIVKYTKTDCTAIGFDPTTQPCGPVAGNKDGAYLTMFSEQGLMFGIINIIGNFGTVFVDQSYWHAAIAAKPASTVKGYMLGGLCWFAIPFSLATSLGLAALALQLPVSYSEANAGLVPAATGVHLFGPGGGVLIVIMVFMAVTAAGSAELIAVASLVTYDIYRTYINPEATGEDIKYISRWCILITGLIMGAFACILNQFKIGLGWVYLFMGIIIGSAVFPIWCCLTWSKATATAALISAFVGQAAGLISWFIAASIQGGEVTVDTLGTNEVMLTGNLFALVGSAFIMIPICLIWPDNYDFSTTKTNITLVENDLTGLDPADYDDDKLAAARKWIEEYGYTFTFLIIIVWPCLALPAGVFPKGYFGFWVAISLIWGLVASIVIIGMPLVEGIPIARNIYYGMLGQPVPPTTSERIAFLEKRVTRLEQEAGLMANAASMESLGIAGNSSGKALV